MASNYLRRARSADIQASRDRQNAQRAEVHGAIPQSVLREAAKRGSFTTDPTNDVIPPQISPERSAFLTRACGDMIDVDQD